MTGKVLVVEDNEKNRILLRDILRHYGHEVLEAANGTEGIEMAKKFRPDIILMDLQMPVMDGFTAGQIIKNDPATKKIRIIAITSFAMKGDREKIMSAGFDDYIAKPVDTRQLPLLVQKHLKA